MLLNLSNGRRFITLLALFAMLLTCGACAKAVLPDPDKNTNWLKPCATTKECGSTLSCTCGACTKACTTDTSCSGVGSAAECKPISQVAQGGRCEASLASAAGAICVASRKAQTDAGADSGQAYAGDGGGSAGASGGGADTCASTNVCTVDYPCAPLAPSYTCRGQFADWTPTDSPAAFTDNRDGTVTDWRSGLVWQRSPPTRYTTCSDGTDAAGSVTCTWAEADAYCSGLVLAGTAWRLPTLAELESIADFGRYGPALDPSAFPSTPGTPAPLFWSSSSYVGDFGYRWRVDLDSGSSSTSAANYIYRVRCVRSSVPVVASTGSGGAPPGRYAFPEIGTVYDTRTKLTWQQAVDANTYTQAQALAYCASLSFGGGGWRLPKVSELLTIADRTKAVPAIDATAFPNTPPDNFWSSSPFVGPPHLPQNGADPSSTAWLVFFGLGDSHDDVITAASRVRCVR